MGGGGALLVAVLVGPCLLPGEEVDPAKRGERLHLELEAEQPARARGGGERGVRVRFGLVWVWFWFGLGQKAARGAALGSRLRAYATRHSSVELPCVVW